MATSIVTYLGDLRTECEHIASSSKYFTDAPVDNNGKGESFSPTDTVATALAGCIFTIMGIKARELQLDLSGSKAEVTKFMAESPRRISKIEIVFHMKGVDDQKHRAILERVGKACPVSKSLHPDIEQKITFQY